MSDEIINTPPCPLCGGSVRMSDMDDEDDLRFWFRTVRCDNCDLTVNSPLPEGRGFRSAAVAPAGPPASPSFSLPASTPSSEERAPRAEPTVPAG